MTNYCADCGGYFTPAGDWQRLCWDCWNDGATFTASRRSPTATTTTTTTSTRSTGGYTAATECCSPARHANSAPAQPRSRRTT